MTPDMTVKAFPDMLAREIFWIQCTGIPQETREERNSGGQTNPPCIVGICAFVDDGDPS